MSHIVDFFTSRFGSGGNIIVGIIFLVMSIIGILVAIRGRQIMVWLVGFCGLCLGILFGAAAGLLIFDSFIIMLITAFVGGTLLLLLVKYVKSIGYFIGIGALGFFIAFTVTSELYIDSTRITENTLLLVDLIAAIIMGILAAIQSKYVISVITSAAGGMIASISILAIFGKYFADWKMWALAMAIAVFGMIMQIRIYDLNSGRSGNRKGK